VVERTNSWFNRFRKLLIRYEKRPQVMRPYWSLLAELLHTGDYLLFMDKLLVVLIIFYFKNI
jgi:demethoxyubiquinone hydroxylase (CLK1/Coq7/Cat5 family)